jgi:hypothetical protein
MRPDNSCETERTGGSIELPAHGSLRDASTTRHLSFNTTVKNISARVGAPGNRPCLVRMARIMHSADVAEDIGEDPVARGLETGAATGPVGNGFIAKAVRIAAQRV